jgi:hypothetical protein
MDRRCYVVEDRQLEAAAPLAGKYKSLVELRAAYMPDATRAGFRVLPS